MKKALIDPSAVVTYVSGWNPPVSPSTRYTPIISVVQNAARVAQVEDNSFQVAPPLFWVDCADNVVADIWYYDTLLAQIVLVPEPVPYPV